MSKNGIAWLATKEAKQKAKLDIAQAKRQGKTITEGGGTYSISGAIDPTKSYYKENNLFDIDELPTQYVDDDVFDNPNPAGLLPARPWISTQLQSNFRITTENGLILITEAGDIIIAD